MANTHPPISAEQAGIHKLIKKEGKRVVTTHPPISAEQVKIKRANGNEVKKVVDNHPPLLLTKNKRSERVQINIGERVVSTYPLCYKN